MPPDNTKHLRWRFDVNTFRLLGRELITDRITAIYELVKNCYDANATRVDIIFEHTLSPKKKDEDQKLRTTKITISDNGTGMSFDDIKNKWMVVGTASKRENTISPSPFKRRYVGEKGIGRFAVDKLGGHLVIKTKQESDSKQLNVTIDWDQYELLSKSKQLTLFTDIDNSYEYSNSEIESNGTILEITSIAEHWTANDLIRLDRELEKLVSPFHRLEPPFNLYIKSPSFTEYADKKVEAEQIKYSSDHYELSFNKLDGKQQSLHFNEESGKVEIESTDVKSFGPVNFKIYYFDQSSKMKFNKAYKDKNYRIDGVKIYRDGLITTPFAEFESSPDKKRDILGIDKRRWSGAFDKIGTREIIGILDISKEDNPKIIDATNRQDFVENKEFRDLKEFIIDQIDTFAKIKKYQREQIRKNTDIALVKANLDIKTFSSTLKNIGARNPKLTKALEPLQRQARDIDNSLQKGIKQQQQERKEHIRKENIYLSLMSLQDYAIHISHAVRTALGKVKHMAEFFNSNFPDPELNEHFENYAVRIYEEMDNLNRIIDFMLSYAGSNIKMEDFSVKSLLENLFTKAYKPALVAENINVEISILEDVTLHANKKFFEDIFQNLISNSSKALKGRKDKKIKCSGSIKNDHFVLYFSDNGEGILDQHKNKIFDMYYTTTADRGGAGIGLYIVKTRIESLKGTIEVCESEFSPQGATFRISFPFNKEDK